MNKVAFAFEESKTLELMLTTKLPSMRTLLATTTWVELFSSRLPEITVGEEMLTLAPK